MEQVVETTSTPTQPDQQSTVEQSQSSHSIGVQENADLVEQSSSAQELEQKMEEANLSEKQKAALRKKYQLKVNNQVREVEVDLSDDEQIKKYLQKALAADEKFQQAAEMRKIMENIILTLKKDPLAVLSHPDINVDVKQLAEMILAKEIEEQQKSPEQKRIEELERALKEKEEQAKRAEEEKRRIEMAKLEQEIFEDINRQIIEGLQKSSLPKSPYVVKRIADTMLSAINMGYHDVSIEQIIPFVEKQIYSELNAIFETAPEDILPSLLEKFAGKKNLDRYRKSVINKLKTKPIEKVKVEDVAAPKNNKSNPEPKDVLDISDLLRAR